MEKEKEEEEEKKGNKMEWNGMK